MVSHQYRYIFGDESGDAGFAIDKGSSNPAAFRWAGGNRLIRLFHRHHTTIMLGFNSLVQQEVDQRIPQ